MTDSLQRSTLLKAPRARVWRALTDAAEFGAWFGVRFDGAFVPGAKLTGTLAPTAADPEVAKAQKAYEGRTFEIVVDRIEPQTLFSFRWHPFAVDQKRDYSNEPMTLVVFTLADAPGGTQLTVTESGFDALPPDRRAQAFEMNDGGWRAQLALIGKHLAR